MTPSDDRRPPRPLLVPVLVAAVLLGVIGASAGLLLASRAGGAGTYTGVLEYPSGEATAPVGIGSACREETQKQSREAGAEGVLRVDLQVRTATSEVWICSDDGGRLFYHANRRRSDGAWIEGETALFLADVVRDNAGYRAVAFDGQGRRTTFMTHREGLVILHKDGGVEKQPAVGG